MKFKFLAFLSMVSMVGMVYAAPQKPQPVKFNDIPIVAKCMEMHQYASIAWNSADPEAANDLKRYMLENFDDEHRFNYTHLINEWNADPQISKAYRELRGPDIHGWSLTPALQMAACIKANEVR